jgi:inner membrane transporter RhtA
MRGQYEVPMRPTADSTRAAVVMAVGSIVSVQCGAALGTTLFDEVGPSGAVFLRALFAALLLLALTRGRGVLPLRREGLGDLILFGVAVAAVTFFFYAALDRLPLGLTVTLQFTGPLGVAIFTSRRRRDALWALPAGAGILLLSDGFGDGGIDPVGAALALTAGGFWALYILQSARVGRANPGLGGLVVSATIAAILLAPLGIAAGGAELLSAPVLAVGLAVGLLSSAVPYVFEMEALRRLPRSVFGVLMSLEPVVAALVGFVALSQDLAAVELLAIALVVLACAGALRSAAAPTPRD